jgi:hypothetical protein
MWCTNKTTRYGQKEEEEVGDRINPSETQSLLQQLLFSPHHFVHPRLSTAFLFDWIFQEKTTTKTTVEAEKK